MPSTHDSHERFFANPNVPEHVERLKRPLRKVRRLGQETMRLVRKQEAYPIPSAESKEIADTIETQHFVREAPRLADVVSDGTDRTNTINYWIDPTSTRLRVSSGILEDEVGVGQTTEHDAITELETFLAKAEHSPNMPAELTASAANLRENLYFIGEQELNEASAGIAEHWKAFLREDPHRKIVIPEGLTQADNGAKRSGDFMFDRIMEHFDPTEQAAFGKQIQRDLDKISRLDDPQATKIVLLDDWSISGIQLDNAFSKVFSHPKSQNAHMEVNLMAASQRQLESPDLQGRKVPTFAYFKTQNNGKKGGALITGAHSSVDFGFSHEIEKMVKVMNAEHRTTNMPALANIKKPY